MPSEKKTRKIIVTEQRKIHSGTNKTTGAQYTIWQVIAQKETGEPIPEGMNLRSFDELPKNQLIEVEVEKFESAQYGTSYTVTQKGKRKGNGLGKRVDEMFSAMKRLNARLEAVERAVGIGGQQPASAQAPPAAPPPSQPPPPPPPVSDGMPTDDDIPF